MGNRNLTKISTIRNKVDNLDKITFIELVGIFGSIKARVLWGMMVGVISYTSIVHFVSTRIQIEKTAIAKNSLFDIVIEEDEVQNCTSLSKKKGIACRGLYLMEPSGPLETSNLQFLIRKSDEANPLDIYPVGKVTTKKIKQTGLPFFSINPLDQPVLAQDNQYSFNWYGHEDSFEFHEKQVDRYTIRRYYKDGWILEYKVDQDQRSIPSTFQWIRKGKCFIGVCLPD